MTAETVRDIEIRIFRSVGKGSCPVAILGENDSRAEGRFRSPFTAAEVQTAILALDQGRFDTDALRQFGHKLFRALIRDEVKTVYDASGGDAEPIGIRLIVDDPRAARIPWELMLDPVFGVPFAVRHRLVRGFATTTEARPLEVVDRPLRLLVASSSPIGVEELDSQLEVEDIREALKPLSDTIEVQVLPHASEASLLNALREGLNADPAEPIHLFHWIGHGGIDPATGNSALLFENEAGGRQVVDGARLATILNGFDIRLVFLNACYSAAPTTETALAESSFVVSAGVAEELLVSGIPAVIGMQANVRDERARSFARNFYQAIADGVRIDAAILDARRLVRPDGGAGGDVGIPVSYLRGGSAGLLQAPMAPAATGIRERFGLLSRGARWVSGIAATTLASAGVVAFVSMTGILPSGPGRGPTPEPTNVPTAGPTASQAPAAPAEYEGELSTFTGARGLVAFAQEFDGRKVRLDVSCIDDFATATCYFEQIGEMYLMWVFTSERCFIEDNADADLESCRGAHVFWIGPTEGTNVSISNGPSGAGSVVIKGEFGLMEQGFGGAVFPVSIRSWNLNPVPL